MKPKITIFTCSYNKPNYVSEAISSVINQTYPNFEYIILENSTDSLTPDIVHKIKDIRVKIFDIAFSEKERSKFYVESQLKNIYTPLAKGEFIMYLADDDILEPICFEEHIKEFERDTSEQINFHGWKVIYMGTDKLAEHILINRHYGVNTRRRPGRKVDGGAVMFKKELLQKVTDPYFKLRKKDAHISDGLFLNRLAQLATFHPIEKILHTKRVTEISSHTYIDDGGNIAANRLR